VPKGQAALQLKIVPHGQATLRLKIVTSCLKARRTLGPKGTTRRRRWYLRNRLGKKEKKEAAKAAAPSEAKTEPSDRRKCH
jgi:hypothetical protein